MPYEIQDFGNGAYKVVSKDTGKVHSKHGMPKARAYAQMRALYWAMGSEAKKKK